MSGWSENLLKAKISPSYSQSGTAKTASSKSSRVKTGDHTGSINTEKWAAIMKQNIILAANTNQSYPVAALTETDSLTNPLSPVADAVTTINNNINKSVGDAAFQKYCDAIVAQQINVENDYNQAMTQLLVQIEDERNVVADYGDVSKQNTCDTNIEQLQLALYKKQMYTGTVGNPGNQQSDGNVDSWVSQAIKQTGVGVDWAPALKWIINMESGGNPNAHNPNTTAYGMMQFLDNTWHNCGAAKTSDPVQQVVAGIDYIKQRYGTAEKAKAFWQENHWY